MSIELLMINSRYPSMFMATYDLLLLLGSTLIDVISVLHSRI